MQQTLSPGPDAISRAIRGNTSFDFSDSRDVAYDKKKRIQKNQDKKVFANVFPVNADQLFVYVE